MQAHSLLQTSAAQLAFAMQVMGQVSRVFTAAIGCMNLSTTQAWHSTAACLFRRSSACDITSSHLSDIHKALSDALNIRCLMYVVFPVIVC